MTGRWVVLSFLAGTTGQNSPTFTRKVRLTGHLGRGPSKEREQGLEPQRQEAAALAIRSLPVRQDGNTEAYLDTCTWHLLLGSLILERSKTVSLCKAR